MSGGFEKLCEDATMVAKMVNKQPPVVSPGEEGARLLGKRGFVIHEPTEENAQKFRLIATFLQETFKNAGVAMDDEPGTTEAAVALSQPALVLDKWVLTHGHDPYANVKGFKHWVPAHPNKRQTIPHGFVGARPGPVRLTGMREGDRRDLFALIVIRPGRFTFSSTSWKGTKDFFGISNDQVETLAADPSRQFSIRLDRPGTIVLCSSSVQFCLQDGAIAKLTYIAKLRKETTRDSAGSRAMALTLLDTKSVPNLGRHWQAASDPRQTRDIWYQADRVVNWLHPDGGALDFVFPLGTNLLPQQALTEVFKAFDVTTNVLHIVRRDKLLQILFPTPFPPTIIRKLAQTLNAFVKSPQDSKKMDALRAVCERAKTKAAAILKEAEKRRPFVEQRQQLIAIGDNLMESGNLSVEAGANWKKVVEERKSNGDISYTARANNKLRAVLRDDLKAPGPLPGEKVKNGKKRKRSPTQQQKKKKKKKTTTQKDVMARPPPSKPSNTDFAAWYKQNVGNKFISKMEEAVGQTSVNDLQELLSVFIHSCEKIVQGKKQPSDQTFAEKIKMIEDLHQLADAILTGSEASEELCCNEDCPGDHARALSFEAIDKIQRCSIDLELINGCLACSLEGPKLRCDDQVAKLDQNGDWPDKKYQEASMLDEFLTTGDPSSRDPDDWFTKLQRLLKLYEEIQAEFESEGYVLEHVHDTDGSFIDDGEDDDDDDDEDEEEKEEDRQKEEEQEEVPEVEMTDIVALTTKRPASDQLTVLQARFLVQLMPVDHPLRPMADELSKLLGRHQSSTEEQGGWTVHFDDVLLKSFSQQDQATEYVQSSLCGNKRARIVGPEE